MDVDSMRIRDLSGSELEALGAREVEIRTDDPDLVAELEDRLERLRVLEERDRRLAGEGHVAFAVEEHEHTDDELVEFMTADRGGRTAELVELVGMAEQADERAARLLAVEARVREIALGADREPVNRRERRHLERARRRLVR